MLVRLLLLWISLDRTNAALSFANYYGDHMVLQQNRGNVIWGYTDTNTTEIFVNFTGYATQLAFVTYLDELQSCIWTVQLAPGHYNLCKNTGNGDATRDNDQKSNITVYTHNETAQIRDVLFGDVWLCSGQSNMQFTMSMVDNASAELDDVTNYPDIRLFTVAEKTSKTEMLDVTVEQPWSIPSKASVGGKDWSYFSAVCWLYGKYLYQKLQYPIGLISTTWGGTPIEAWSSRDAMAACPTEGSPGKRRKAAFHFPSDPSVLWNAMIHPLLNLTVYGAIWYQGEANAHAPASYGCRFPAMIRDWREKFHDGSLGNTRSTFPFGFVQLAGNRNDVTIRTGFPDIRWHQTADTGYVPNDEMPKTFMAVAMDLPDFKSPYGSIHPRDKQDVAARLALSGLAIAYQLNVGKFQGPRITAYQSYTDLGLYTIKPVFDNGTSPIEVRSKNGFELCCSINNQSKCDGKDSKWVEFPIVDFTDSTITLNYTNGCARQWIMGIRYAWRESPCDFKQCAIYSVENKLPMAPFVTIGLINSP